MGTDVLSEPVRLDVKKLSGLDQKVWRENVRLLEEYTGKPLEKIEEEYNNAISGIEFEWQKKIHESPSPELIRKYYETCTTYLFELSAADSLKEQQREYHKVVRYVKKQGFTSIMDFGGGAGGFSCFMSRRGFSVTYFDVVGNTSRFSEWKFKKLGLNVRTAYDFAAVPNESLDAIHSADCLEHVPNLTSIFRKFSEKLKPGGRLILKATFHGGGIHLRENEKYHDINVYIDTLSDHGFRFTGQLKDDRLTFNLNKIIPTYAILFVYTAYRKKISGNYLIFEKAK